MSETTFAGRLVAVRAAKGKSRRALAVEAGLDEAHLYRLEVGERAPSWEIVCRLADALECSTDELRPGRAAEKT